MAKKERLEAEVRRLTDRLSDLEGKVEKETGTVLNHEMKLREAEQRLDDVAHEKKRTASALAAVSTWATEDSRIRRSCTERG